MRTLIVAVLAVATLLSSHFFKNFNKKFYKKKKIIKLPQIEVEPGSEDEDDVGDYNMAVQSDFCMECRVEKRCE